MAQEKAKIAENHSDVDNVYAQLQDKSTRHDRHGRRISSSDEETNGFDSHNKNKRKRIISEEESSEEESAKCSGKYKTKKTNIEKGTQPALVEYPSDDEDSGSTSSRDSSTRIPSPPCLRGKNFF